MHKNHTVLLQERMSLISQLAWMNVARNCERYNDLKNFITLFSSRVRFYLSLNI